MQLSGTKFRKSFILSTKKWIKCFPGKNPVNSREKSGDITRRAARLWRLVALTSFFPLPARGLVSSASLPFQALELDWLRPQRHSSSQSAPSTIICSRSACCLRLLQTNAPSRCSHPRCPSIPAPHVKKRHPGQVRITRDIPV